MVILVSCSLGQYGWKGSISILCCVTEGMVGSSPSVSLGAGSWGQCPFGGLPTSVLVILGGVLGISLELLTCCGYRDRLQTVGGNVSISVSGKVSKNSKSLPGWPCHVHTPKLGFTCSPHISESVLWVCSVTLCYFSCKCSSPTSLWCFSMVQPFLS